MEGTKTLPEIRVALMDAARVLEEVSDQAFHIESSIKRVIGNINSLENGKNTPAPEKKEANIIPFPVKMNRQEKTNMVNPGNYDIRPFLFQTERKHPFLVPIPATPGSALPVSIPDFRHKLQRDGLILLSWDKQHTEKGELFTAYWVTSTGVSRYFASAPLPEEDFAYAQPDHKSYAAEDGIEFYGEPRPYYVVHVAPQLMMNRRGKSDERPEHIALLKSQGINTDFDHKFLLTREKKKFPRRRRAEDNRKTGA